MDNFPQSYKILQTKMLTEINIGKAGPEGFEPPAYGLRVHRSTWLSYGPALTAYYITIYTFGNSE